MEINAGQLQTKLLCDASFVQQTAANIKPNAQTELSVGIHLVVGILH